MKFKILVADENNQDNPHWEDYDKETDDPVEWANNTIGFYNMTLRGGEQPRVLLKVIKGKETLYDSSNNIIKLEKENESR